METRIQKKEAFRVAGIKMEDFDKFQCPQAWETLFENHSVSELIGLGSGQSYGVCYHVDDPGHMNYLAGFDVTDQIAADAMNLEVVDIPAGEYAVIQLKGPVPTCIHEGWTFVKEEFFPEQGYLHSGAPDFEVYQEGDMDSDDYEMELWVPIKRAE